MKEYMNYLLNLEIKFRKTSTEIGLVSDIKMKELSEDL